MNTQQSTTKETRVAILQKEITLKYPGNTHAFTIFAEDLASEDAKLQDLINRIFKKISAEKKSSELKKLNTLLTTTTTLKTNLQALANTVNQIIMG